MSEKLKPCPFCGSEKSTIFTDRMEPDMIYRAWIECNTDDCCSGPHAYWFEVKSDAEAEAVNNWNQRFEPEAS